MHLCGRGCLVRLLPGGLACSVSHLDLQGVIVGAVVALPQVCAGAHMSSAQQQEQEQLEQQLQRQGQRRQSCSKCAGSPFW